jgi:hypothetical protein
MSTALKIHTEMDAPGDDNALIVLEEIQNKLAGIACVDEAKEVADQAAALGLYAKRAKKGLVVQNHCAWVKLLAERRAGELLQQMDKLTGRPEKASSATRLSDLGITYDQSSRWQALAKVEVDRFDSMLKKCDKGQEEFTSAYVWRQLRSVLSRDDYLLATKPFEWESTLKATEADNAANRLLKAVWGFADNLQAGRLHGDMGLVLASRATLLLWQELGALERSITDGWEKHELEDLTLAFVECRRQVDRCIEALRRRLDDAPVTWQEEGRGLMDYVDERRGRIVRVGKAACRGRGVKRTDA